jgi:N-formylglutamate amidohydrolase
MPHAEPSPFLIDRPGGAPGPLVLASPHSGCFYPPSLMSQTRLDALTLRRSEDAYVDTLISAGVRFGCAVISAQFARAYVDVNRDPLELDPAMFSDALPGNARAQSDRVAAGLGAIPRVVGIGLDIYGGKLRYAEEDRRLTGVHQPYHRALRQLLEEARARHGYGVLLDWHSMPSQGVNRSNETLPDIVLGDRRGRACAPVLMAEVASAFQALGYRVNQNDPYAGGYTTETYGRPAVGLHALQIEIDRGLYLDEARIEPTGDFETLRADITTVLRRVSETLPSLRLASPGRMAAE